MIVGLYQPSFLPTIFFNLVVENIMRKSSESSKGTNCNPFGQELAYANDVDRIAWNAHSLDEI